MNNCVLIINNMLNLGLESGEGLELKTAERVLKESDNKDFRFGLTQTKMIERE